MTVNIANTSNTATFQYWLNRTNEMAEAFRVNVVTVESDPTSGNLSLIGSFEANNIHVSENLRGGNIDSTAVLTISSNVYITDQKMSVGNSTVNSTVNSSSFISGNSTVNSVLYSTYLKIENPTIQANLTPNSLKLGNSTINAITNSSQLTISDETDSVKLTTVNLTFGNSTVNAVSNSTALKISSATSNVTITNVNIGGNANAQLNVINASSLTTTTGVFPTSNASGTALGNTTNRWILNANTIDATGLVTVVNLNSSATINAASDINIGTNLTANTTAVKIGSATVNLVANSTTIKLANSTTDVTITKSSITGNANAEFNNVTTVGYVNAAGLFVYGTNTHIGNNTTQADATLRVDGTANVTGNVFISENLTVAGNLVFTSELAATANISPVSNGGATGYWLGNTTGLWNAYTNTVIVSGTGGVYPSSNTTGNKLGNTTNRWIISANTIDLSSNLVIGTTFHANTSTLRIADGSTNSTINSTALAFNNVLTVQDFQFQTTTTGTTSQVVDSFLKASWISGEYTITIKDGSANASQISKLLVVHAADVADINEYGVVTTDGTLGVFTATTNTTHVVISVTPVVSSTTIKGSKKLYNV
jgi:hypothetical protein